jgi:hypothetical protein
MHVCRSLAALNVWVADDMVVLVDHSMEIVLDNGSISLFIVHLRM